MTNPPLSPPVPPMPVITLCQSRDATGRGIDLWQGTSPLRRPAPMQLATGTMDLDDAVHEMACQLYGLVADRHAPNIVTAGVIAWHGEQGRTLWSLYDAYLASLPGLAGAGDPEPAKEAVLALFDGFRRFALATLAMLEGVASLADDDASPVTRHVLAATRMGLSMARRVAADLGRPEMVSASYEAMGEGARAEVTFAVPPGAEDSPAARRAVDAWLSDCWQGWEANWHNIRRKALSPAPDSTQARESGSIST